MIPEDIIRKNCCVNVEIVFMEFESLDMLFVLVTRFAEAFCEHSLDPGVVVCGFEKSDALHRSKDNKGIYNLGI